MQALVLTIVVLFIGAYINGKVAFLRNYNIPRRCNDKMKGSCQTKLPPLRDFGTLRHSQRRLNQNRIAVTARPTQITRPSALSPCLPSTQAQTNGPPRGVGRRKPIARTVPTESAYSQLRSRGRGIRALHFVDYQKGCWTTYWSSCTCIGMCPLQAPLRQHSRPKDFDS